MLRSCHFAGVWAVARSLDDSSDPEKAPLWSSTWPDRDKTVVTLLKEPLLSCSRAYLAAFPQVNDDSSRDPARTGGSNSRYALRPATYENEEVECLLLLSPTAIKRLPIAVTPIARGYAQF